MKCIVFVILFVLYLSTGCGDSYYDNVIGITPIDDISDKTTASMGRFLHNTSVFNNLSS